MEQQPNIARISLGVAIVSLWVRRLSVGFLLASWTVPQVAARLFSTVRSLPRRRAAAAAVLATVIVVPSGLFVRERLVRLEQNAVHRQMAVSSESEIAVLHNTLDWLVDEQADLRSLLLDAGYSVVHGDQMSVRLVATGYSSSVWETDDTPYLTAANTRTRPGVVAMSRDLIRRYSPNALFSFGDTIRISGLGDFVVEDSMHPRWQNRVDIWFPSPDAARNFGKRHVVVTKPLDSTDVDDETAEAGEAGSVVTGYVSNAALPQ
jgi:3D (Asp-Asp-Asp) domain-containing protein